MSAHVLDLKRQTVLVLFAVAFALFGGMMWLSVSAEPPVNTANLPEFAKNVRVIVAGKKVSLDEALRNSMTDERLTTYRQLRTEAGGSPNGQLELARWCRKQKLAEEERLHWRLLLMTQPGQPDAMKGLGLRMYDGQMLTREQVVDAKQEARLVKDAKRKWATTIKRLKLAIEQDDPKVRQAAVDEIEAIRDPRVMSLVEKELSNGSAAAGLLVVEMYGRAATQQATDVLARLAIHAKDAAMREKAAGELRYRPVEKYMPVLVGAMAAPIELSVNTDVKPGGPKYEWWDGYAYLADEAGRVRVVPGMYRMIRLSGNYTNKDVAFWVPETIPFSGWWYMGDKPDHHTYQYVLTRDSPDPNAPYEYRGALNADEYRGENGKARASLDRAIAVLEERVRKTNEAAAELNLRIDAAIREATKGQPADDQPPKVEKAADVRPRLWWDWWQKQLQLNNYFASGTEVWTQLGIRPIENVMVGDRVLTRSLDTGDLAFSLVIGIDLRHDAEVHAIEVGGRTFIATPDQPFFVPHERWLSAKDLKPGTEIESLAGKSRVESMRRAQPTKRTAFWSKATRTSSSTAKASWSTTPRDRKHLTALVSLPIENAYHHAWWRIVDGVG